MSDDMQEKVIEKYGERIEYWKRKALSAEADTVGTHNLSMEVMVKNVELEKENAEYQKGMIADAMIIKEADNKIIKLEKKISILEVKAVARNGRILDLEQFIVKNFGTAKKEDITEEYERIK